MKEKTKREGGKEENWRERNGDKEENAWRFSYVF